MNKEEELKELIYFVEARFGTLRKGTVDVLMEDPLRINGDETEVAVYGVIDRISYHKKKGWRIWDYKITNKTPPKGKVLSGIEFQLPVYLMALYAYADTINSINSEEIERATFYQVKNDCSVSQSGKWDSKLHNEHAGTIRSNILKIAASQSGGYFHHPLQNNPDQCGTYINFCPFREICRKDHETWDLRSEALLPEHAKLVYRVKDQKFDREDLS